MRAREFSAVEYVQAMLERNREVVHLNAVICLDEDRLLHAASQRDGHRQDNDNPALLGAPVLLKDNINSADLPTTGCTPALKGHFPPANAPVAQLLLDAGAVIFGKANMHELAFGITNNNPTFGPARNPYNPGLIPGGSSGGTAAAIRGHTVAGIGTDTGVSTRLPAALCGICGFRPTVGRYPTAGVIPISTTRDTPGPMASPDVKEVYSAVVSEAAYRDAIAIHRPEMQAVFSDYFADNNLDALVIPTVPLTAPPIGHDNTVELNGQQLPTMPTIIRNTDPSSNVGIPSLSVAVGLAADGLPVGVCLEGSAGSDRKILAIGKALQDEVGFLPRPGIRAKGEGIEFRPHSTKQ